MEGFGFSSLLRLSRADVSPHLGRVFVEDGHSAGFACKGRRNDGVGSSDECGEEL